MYASISHALIDFCFIRTRLSGSVGQLRREDVDLMELVFESSRVEERSEIESVVVWTVRLHVHTRGEGRPAIRHFHNSQSSKALSGVYSHLMPVDSMREKEMLDLFRNLVISSFNNAC